MCSGKITGALGTAAGILAPVATIATLGTVKIGKAVVKGAVSLLSGGTPTADKMLEGVVEAPKPEIDTTKSIYKQDVTAKAVAAAQVKEQKAIKARKGTGATILTNPLGIEKNATILKPTLGVVSDENKKTLLGA